MANLPEAAVWEPGIFQIETDTIAMGGPDGASNLQARQLANRTLFLATAAQTLGNDLRDVRDRTEALEDGVRRIRAVADIAALAALAAQAGELALVPGRGVYRYDPDSSRDESLPWVVESSHGGRWEHATADSVLPNSGGEYPAHGLATLDAEGRVPAASVRHGIVALEQVAAKGAGAAFDEFEYTTFPPPPQASSLGGQVELLTGDVVEVTATVRVKTTGIAGTEYVDLWLEANDPAEPNAHEPIFGTRSSIFESADRREVFAGRFVASRDGLHDIRLFAAVLTSDGGKAELFGEAAIWGTVYRP